MQIWRTILGKYVQELLLLNVMSNSKFWRVFLLFSSLLSFSADKDFLLEWKPVGQCKSIFKNSDSEVLQLHNITSLIKDVNINGFSVSLPKLKSKQKKRYIGIRFRIRYYPVQKDNFSKHISIQDIYSPYRNLSFFISPDKITRTSDFSHTCSIFSKPGPEIYRPELYFSKDSIMYSFRKCAIVYDTQKKIIHLYENDSVFQQKSPVPMNDCVLTFYWYELQYKNKIRIIEISTPTFINTDSLEISLSNDADFVKGKYHNPKIHKNNVDAVFHEGMNLLYGNNPDPEKGFRLIASAARKKHALALHEMGVCYFRGIAVEPNHALTKKYLTQAAELGVLESAYLLDLICRSETPSGTAFQKIRIKGVPFNNPYLNFDLRSDLKTLQKMLKVTNNHKIFTVGLTHSLKNTNDPLIRSKCLTELQAIASLPYPPAMLALSQLLPEKEIFYLKAAAELGLSTAVLQLLKKGLFDVRKLNLENIVFLWRENPEFILYYSRDGKPDRKLSESIQFLNAGLNRYLRRYDGIAERAEIQKALRILQQSVDRGDPAAVFFYSRLLMEGDFISQNLVLGDSLLKRLADKYPFTECIRLIYLLHQKKLVDEKLFRQLIARFPEDYLPYELYARHLKNSGKSFVKYCRQAKALGSLKAIPMLTEAEINNGNHDIARKLHSEYIKQDTILRNRLQYQPYSGPGITAFTYWFQSNGKTAGITQADPVVPREETLQDASVKKTKKRKSKSASKIKFREW